MEPAYEIDLTVPLDLYASKEVIKQLGKKPPILSSPFRRHMVSTAVQTGPKLAEFRIYRWPKGHRRAYSPPTLMMRGELKATSDNQTHLQGRVHINWIGYTFNYAMPGLILGFISSGVLAYAFFQSNLVMRVLIFLAILIFAYGISRMEIKRGKVHLVNALTRALSGD
jgi:hypothetical protein